MKPTWQSDCGTVSLYLADAVEVLPSLEAESVEAVITDPPYPKEFDAVWDTLGDLAPRVIVDGGHLLTLCGHYQLPRVLEALSKNLRYHWLCILPNAAGITPIMHGFGVKVNFKPCLWFVKGKRSKHPIMDDQLFRAGKSWKKHLHAWNQPIVFGPIVKLVHDSGTVLDPFLGSGTNGVACVQASRRFVGIEKDPATFRRAKRRIKEALNSQPLFKDQEPQLVQGAFA